MATTDGIVLAWLDGMGTLVDDLSRPEAYGEHEAGPVEVIATHISWVFRMPTEVFKVKRPVDLGFLDFRTIEARRRACDAELILNQRLAPAVYLDVVPIHRDAQGRHALKGDGQVVDWAVRMVRLPDLERADALLARGELGGGEIDRLATKLAEFHSSVRCDAETARHGQPDAIQGNVEENFAATRAWGDRYLTEHDARAVERFQRDFLRGHVELLERRAREKHVRDGHGDLRLEHVYVDARRDIRVIDCIEFNERFRFADVCADLAFLAMDLSWHGRSDLAERLLARYAQATDDYDLYAVVDFYESYRAYVRGKIAGMMAADPDAPDEARARGAEEARRYFLLALVADRRPVVSPVVVAVGGMIASGKSTVADALGLALGAPVIDADRTRKHLLGVAPEHPVHDRAWEGAYGLGVTNRVYDEVLRRADVVLASGRPVVLDASFRAAGQRDAARALAERHNVPFHFVECMASEEVCRDRLHRRAAGGGVSDGRLAIFDEFRARYEDVVELSPAQHIVLDTAQPLERSLAKLRATLPTWPRGVPG